MTTTTAPFAWTVFENSAPSFSRSDWIEKVNSFVNNGISPEFGDPPRLDTYRIWPERGWCHDYAITKRYELLLRKFVASDLQLCECKTDDGTEHMVLIADGLVMDNLNQTVRPVARLGYRIVRMQSKGNPDTWEV